MKKKRASVGDSDWSVIKCQDHLPSSISVAPTALFVATYVPESYSGCSTDMICTDKVGFQFVDTRA